MLPLDERWYRRLLALALAFGVVGGLGALAYSLVTGASIRLLFGEPTSDPFSGQWWWIPLIGAGAVLVVFLRHRTGTSGHQPGAIALARKGWVEPSTALQLTIISAISLMVGASLGPSFGIVVSAGGFAAWVAQRQRDAGESERTESALTGMAGGLGAVFSAPLFAALMASELSPTTKRDYVAAFIPQFIAAIVGFVIFFGVTGKVMLDSFDVPGYDFEYWHLLAAVGLGLAAVLLAVLQVAISASTKRVAALMPNPYLRAAVLGATIGVVAFALPLTATGGSGQLTFATEHIMSLGLGLLAATLVAKMLAMALSQAAGFLGGSVFPMLFIGGTAGMLIHELFPAIPPSLSVAAMLAALPGSVIGAPVSFMLIGVGTVGTGVEGLPAIGVAVVIAHLGGSALQLHRHRDG